MAVLQPAPPSDLSLEALRREIDAIDDAVQDLLIRRADMVAGVASAKAREGTRPTLFRPGREAVIMRRLIGRNRPPLPPEVLIRVWREIISALTRLQGPFAVAASTPKCVELARDHFGTAALQSVSSVAAIVNAVAKDRAQLGVLPLPTPAPRGDAAWWRALPPGVQIVARLPFLVRGVPRESAGALVIGRQAFEPSGDDGAFFMLETTATVGAVRAALKVSGFAPGHVVMATGKNGSKMFLVETETWRPDEAARLTRLAEQIGGTAQVLGGFARPIVIAARSTP